MSDAKTLVIFDIDGTLLFSNSLDSRCFGKSYERVFGKKFPSLDWNDFPHVTDHTIFNKAYQDHFGEVCSPESRLAFEADYIELMKEERDVTPHEFCEVPGAKDLIDQLHGLDRYEVGIATGGWRNPAIFKLDHVKINYDPIYASYADNMETRQDIVQDSINQAKDHHSINKVVYIGDAEWDVLTTNQMNIPLIGIRRTGDHSKLLDLGVEHVFSDYLDSFAFIKTIDTI